MSDSDLLPGLIVKAQSGIFDVETEQGIIASKLRGRLMKERMESDAAALGDRVQISKQPEGLATIEVVEERVRVLSRKSPGRST
jgi:putative ribosome biogenesis GTPase RsgA